MFHGHLIAQRFEHGFKTLFFGEKLGVVFPVFVEVDNDVFGGGNEAMLNSAVTANRFLVSPCVEKSEIESIFMVIFWKEDGV